MYCINYTIKKGDTLYKISRQYKIGVSAIIDANPFVNVYNLIVGETICIPVSVPSNKFTEYTPYLVEEGDTMGSILEKNNINLADMMDFNNLSDLYLMPGTNINVPTAY